MATEIVTITAQKIDSFIFVAHRLPGTKSPCAIKGCTRTGRVKLFWRERREDNQQVSSICINHAFDLSNEILSHYKFRDEQLAFSIESVA